MYMYIHEHACIVYYYVHILYMYMHVRVLEIDNAMQTKAAIIKILEGDLNMVGNGLLRQLDWIIKYKRNQNKHLMYTITCTFYIHAHVEVEYL